MKCKNIYTVLDQASDIQWLYVFGHTLAFCQPFLTDTDEFYEHCLFFLHDQMFRFLLINNSFVLLTRRWVQQVKFNFFYNSGASSKIYDNMVCSQEWESEKKWHTKTRRNNSLMVQDSHVESGAKGAILTYLYK